MAQQYILVSVAWPYANSDIHQGNVTGSYLPADIYARFHRLQGNHVLMVSGSDVHGTPITVKADEEGVSPEEIVDRYGKAPPQLRALAQAQEVRVAAQRIGATAVQRRGGRWRLRLDPAVDPPELIGEVLTTWPQAQLSPSGEITIPSGAPGTELDEVHRLLQGLAG